MLAKSTTLVRICASILLLFSLAGALVHARPDPAYRVRVLPLEFPFVTGFNDRHQAIGYAPQDLTSVGFLWDAKHGVQFIYPSGMYADNRAWAIPFDINKHGEVVPLAAPLWTPQTGMENLGHLHTGYDVSLSHALDINQHGTVIGVSLGWIYFAGEYEMVLPRAFVWTRRTGMLPLDDLVPAGWIVANVIAINDHDEILESASHPTHGSHTVVLEPLHGSIR